MRIEYIPNGPERAKKEWFASDHSHWLYWKRRTRPVSHQRIQVDLQARSVINALAAKGVSTTLSAQGRVWSDDDIRTAYKAILEDLRRVRGDGLALKNVETLEEVVWQDPQAICPWSSWQKMKNAITYGGRGHPLRSSRRSYLGVVNQWEDPEYLVNALKVHLPSYKEFDVEIKNGIIGVFVPCSEEGVWLDIEAAWRYALSIAGKTCTQTSM